jgi:hypothetical protein
LLDNYFEERVRERLLLKNRIIEIIDLNDSVFESAVVHSMIFAFQKLHQDSYAIKIGIENRLYGKNTLVPKSFLLKQDKLLFSVRSYQHRDLLQKLSMNSRMLNKVLDLRQAIKTGNDEKYIRDAKLGSNYKPILRGKDVLKWQINDPGLFVDYGPHLACPRDRRIFEQPKILIREAGKEITAAYDDKDYYIMSSLYNAILLDNSFSLKYLLTLLNSKLFQYQMNILTLEKTKGAFTKAKIYHYYNLPIKDIDLRGQKSFIDLAEKIMEWKKKDPQKATEPLAKEIDQLVYALYDLSPTEIDTVETFCPLGR